MFHEMVGLDQPGTEFGNHHTCQPRQTHPPRAYPAVKWTGFAKGNKEAAIKMVVFGLVLGALAAPVYTKVFMGATVDVDMLHMFRQIVLFVFVPLAASLLTQVVAKNKFGAQTWNQRI